MRSIIETLYLTEQPTLGKFISMVLNSVVGEIRV